MMTPTKRKIIITGTHLTPALELIRQLQEDKTNIWEIIYLGRTSNSTETQQSSIESEIIPSLGVTFYSLPCGKLDRRYFPNTIKGIPKTINGFFKSFFLIKKIQPDIIISFGGYVSVPTVFSAWLQKITCITHEQTLTNSFTTKINSFFVKKIALSFNNQKQIKKLPAKKVVITGNLLRYQLFQKPLLLPPKIKFKNSKLPLVYITAGNQGSHQINLIIKKLLPQLSPYNIIHQTGKNDFEAFNKLKNKHPNYFVSDYFNTQDYSWIIQRSNIFISRGGANTCQEIVAFNKKSILIPLPKSQQNEQYLNALWVKKNQPKITIIIPQQKLNPNLLLKSLNTINNITNINQPKKLIPNLKLLQLINETI